MMPHTYHRVNRCQIIRFYKKHAIHEDRLGLVNLVQFRLYWSVVLFLSLSAEGKLMNEPIGVGSDLAPMDWWYGKRARHYVSFSSHLNINLKNVTWKWELVRDEMNFINDLFLLIKLSPKRITPLNSLMREVNIISGKTTPSLFTYTKMDFRHSSIESIPKIYK